MGASEWEEVIIKCSVKSITMSQKEEFNGYSFDKPKMRKKMKYVVITRGDLDLNGAYAFTSKGAVRSYLHQTGKEVEAIFEVKDVTNDI